jgi:hypothetical protein
MNKHLNKEGQEWKIDHTKGKALMGEEELKMEVKKVNMVDELSIKEWI